jgi:hypothetical protein
LLASPLYQNWINNLYSPRELPGNLKITPFAPEEFVLNEPRRREEREEKKKKKEVHSLLGLKGVIGENLYFDREI